MKNSSSSVGRLGAGLGADFASRRIRSQARRSAAVAQAADVAQAPRPAESTLVSTLPVSWGRPPGLAGYPRPGSSTHRPPEDLSPTPLAQARYRGAGPQACGVDTCVDSLRCAGQTPSLQPGPQTRLLLTHRPPEDLCADTPGAGPLPWRRPPGLRSRHSCRLSPVCGADPQVCSRVPRPGSFQPIAHPRTSRRLHWRRPATVAQAPRPAESTLVSTLSGVWGRPPGPRRVTRPGSSNPSPTRGPLADTPGAGPLPWRRPPGLRSRHSCRLSPVCGADHQVRAGSPDPAPSTHHPTEPLAHTPYRGAGPQACGVDTRVDSLRCVGQTPRSAAGSPDPAASNPSPTRGPLADSTGAGIATVAQAPRPAESTLVSTLSGVWGRPPGLQPGPQTRLFQPVAHPRTSPSRPSVAQAPRPAESTLVSTLSVSSPKARRLRARQAETPPQLARQPKISANRDPTSAARAC